MRPCRIDFHCRKDVAFYGEGSMTEQKGFAQSTILAEEGFCRIIGGYPPAIKPLIKGEEHLLGPLLSHLERRRVGGVDDIAAYIERRLTNKRYAFFDGTFCKGTEESVFCGFSARVSGVPVTMQFACEGIDELTVPRMSSMFDAFVNYSLSPRIDFIPSCGDFVFGGKACGIFMHEFIGHSLERDNYIRSRLGRCFPSCSKINIVENYGISDVYDDLGNPIPRDLPLLKDGKVLNLMERGNYRVSFYDTPFPVIRMRGMRVSEGDKTKDTLIGETSQGVFIEEIDDGEIDHTTGELSFNIRKARLIEDGLLCDYLMPFSFFANIDNLATSFLEFGDAAESSCIACGKEGSLVAVSVEAPSMKVHSIEGVGRCG